MIQCFDMKSAYVKRCFFYFSIIIVHVCISCCDIMDSVLQIHKADASEAVLLQLNSLVSHKFLIYE